MRKQASLKDGRLILCCVCKGRSVRIRGGNFVKTTDGKYRHEASSICTAIEGNRRRKNEAVKLTKEEIWNQRKEVKEEIGNGDV